jgi:hypothetical protein
MSKQQTERGQGLLELAVILPVLLILLMGVVEIGYALRDYLIVVNANREGCRFAARGRFSDSSVGERVVSAGGVIRPGSSATDVPFLRTYGTDPNTGILVTHIPMQSSGDVEPLSVTVWISGVLPSEAGVPRQITRADTALSRAQIVERHGPATRRINAAREAAGYDQMSNHIVVVEVFFMHHPLWNNPFVPLPDPWMMYAQTEMRVVSDRGTLR